MKIVVNVITIFRFLYTLILPILYEKVNATVFIINILILFLTDSIDGMLARKFKVQTLFGSAMDTIADKTLCIMLLLMIIRSNKLLILLVIGELTIVIINAIVGLNGKKTKASIFGKVKMWFISITIILAYINEFNIGINKIVVNIAIAITVLMQSVTIITYIITYRKQKKSKLLKIGIKKAKKTGRLTELLFDTDYYLQMKE